MVTSQAESSEKVAVPVAEMGSARAAGNTRHFATNASALLVEVCRDGEHTAEALVKMTELSKEVKDLREEFRQFLQVWTVGVCGTATGGALGAAPPHHGGPGPCRRDTAKCHKPPGNDCSSRHYWRDYPRDALTQRMGTAAVTQFTFAQAVRQTGQEGLDD
ncbi:unnamed protein product [Leuciscus chuanchicus]